MEIKNDSNLNYIFQKFEAACNLHNVVHHIILEQHYDLKHLPPEQRNLKKNVTQIFLETLDRRRIELLEYSIDAYKRYKENKDKEALTEEDYKLAGIKNVPTNT